MTLEERLAAAFQMDEDTWRRHANPWSVYTRFTSLPLLALAVWSRSWIGRWVVLPVALVLLWIWLNPRIFPPPESLDNWASKGVLGERIWLQRNKTAVPERHRVLPNVLNAISFVGMGLYAWGLVARSVWSTVLGTVVMFLSKLWFVDRMVWLYDDMRER